MRVENAWITDEEKQFLIDEIEEETSHQIPTSLIPNYQSYRDNMDRLSREAWKYLGLSMYDTRALKNRTGAETIGDLVMLAR